MRPAPLAAATNNREERDDRDSPRARIPAIVDANSMTYVLHRALGDEIVVSHGDRPVRLRLVAVLSDSIFQSELVMSDDSFAKTFPKTGGYRVFMIRTPAGKEESVARVLGMGFRANGLIATPTREKVAAF